MTKNGKRAKEDKALDLTEGADISQFKYADKTVFTIPKRGRGRPKKPDHLKKNYDAIQARETKKKAHLAKFRPLVEKYCMAIAAGARAKQAMAVCGLTWEDIRLAGVYDPTLRVLMEEAKAERQRIQTEEIEDEVYHRAVEGYEEPIASAGRVVAHKTVRSDRLIEMLYRTSHPEQFIQRHESNVNVSARTVSDLIKELELKTPIGSNGPSVFIGEVEPNKLISAPAEDADVEYEDEKPAASEED